MKVLHTKSAAETVLLVSTCPSMNLFAIVTCHAATVYRSTTLTVVASVTLCPYRPCCSLGHSCTRDDGAGQAAGARRRRAIHGTEVDDAKEWMKCSMRAAWSPSGRVFTLALPDGSVWLLDIETDDLLRCLTPRLGNGSGVADSTAAAEEDKTTTRTTEEEDGLPYRFHVHPHSSAADNIAGANKGCRACACAGAAGNSPTPTRTPFGASSVTCASLSTHAGPVAALAWVSIAAPRSSSPPPPLSFASTATHGDMYGGGDRRRDGRPYGPDDDEDEDEEEAFSSSSSSWPSRGGVAYDTCLSVPPHPCTILLDELITASSTDEVLAGAAPPLTQGAYTDKEEESTAVAAVAAAAAATDSAGVVGGQPGESHRVSVLLVLDMTGTLSCVLGGLQEVHAMRCVGGGGGATIRQMLLVPSPADSSGVAGGGASMASDVHFFRAANVSRVGGGAAAAAPVRPPGHDLYVVVSPPPAAVSDEGGGGIGATRGAGSDARPAPSRPDAAAAAAAKEEEAQASSRDQPPRSAAQDGDTVYVIHLGDRLTRVAQSQRVSYCAVYEHCRRARACYHDARARWGGLIHRQIRPHLRLPESAALLREAVLEELAQPDVERLRRYYDSLHRGRLWTWLTRLEQLLCRITRRVYNVCYRCLDAALTILAPPHACGVSDEHYGRVASRRSMERRSSSSSSSSSRSVSSSSSSGRDCAQHTPVHRRVRQTRESQRWHSAGAHRGESTGVSAETTATMRYARLVHLIAQLRRRSERLLRRLRVECEQEKELLTWVIQRASLMVGPYGPPVREPFHCRTGTAYAAKSAETTTTTTTTGRGDGRVHSDRHRIRLSASSPDHSAHHTNTNSNHHNHHHHAAAAAEETDGGGGIPATQQGAHGQHAGRVGAVDAEAASLRLAVAHAPEPLRAVRHPTLLRTLTRIMKQSTTTSFDGSEEDTDDAEEGGGMGAPWNRTLPGSFNDGGGRGEGKDCVEEAKVPRGRGNSRLSAPPHAFRPTTAVDGDACASDEAMDESLTRLLQEALRLQPWPAPGHGRESEDEVSMKVVTGLCTPMPLQHVQIALAVRRRRQQHEPRDARRSAPWNTKSSADSSPRFAMGALWRGGGARCGAGNGVGAHALGVSPTDRADEGGGMLHMFELAKRRAYPIQRTSLPGMPAHDEHAVVSAASAASTSPWKLEWCGRVCEARSLALYTQRVYSGTGGSSEKKGSMTSAFGTGGGGTRGGDGAHEGALLLTTVSHHVEEDEEQQPPPQQQQQQQNKALFVFRPEQRSVCAPGEEQHGRDTSSGTSDMESEQRHVEVRGITLRGTLSVSLSRAREFCVLAVDDKFIVVDVYQDV